jgi:hypothetical protein
MRRGGGLAWVLWGITAIFAVLILLVAMRGG